MTDPILTETLEIIGEGEIIGTRIHTEEAGATTEGGPPTTKGGIARITDVLSHRGAISMAETGRSEVAAEAAVARGGIKTSQDMTTTEIREAMVTTVAGAITTMVTVEVTQAEVGVILGRTIGRITMTGEAIEEGINRETSETATGKSLGEKMTITIGDLLIGITTEVVTSSNSPAIEVDMTEEAEGVTMTEVASTTEVDSTTEVVSMIEVAEVAMTEVVVTEAASEATEVASEVIEVDSEAVVEEAASMMMKMSPNPILMMRRKLVRLLRCSSLKCLTRQLLSSPHSLLPAPVVSPMHHLNSSSKRAPRRRMM
jgi:hypothetical protein